IASSKVSTPTAGNGLHSDPSAASVALSIRRRRSWRRAWSSTFMATSFPWANPTGRAPPPPTPDVIAGTPAARDVARRMMLEAKAIGDKLGVHFRVDVEKRLDGAGAVGAHRQ